ncbi:MAG: hypothetical protein CSB33_03575 [Desulfobacterales bacterium]|nr:MAG: hypothetical protein CSB33_03575 [Desulfobacterales bacterium]
MKRTGIVALSAFFTLMCAGATALAMSGGPDRFGNKYFDSNEENAPGFTWEDVEGREIKLRNDQMSEYIPIGFDFEFYGKSYAGVYISSNGFLAFSEGYGSGCCHGKPIPTHRGYQTNMIAGLWDDLNPSP